MKFCSIWDKADPVNFLRGQMSHISEIQHSQVQPHKLKDCEQCPQNLRENDIQGRILYPAKIIEHKYSVDILRHTTKNFSCCFS